MRSVVLTEPHHVALRDVPNPTVPDGHVLLRMLYGGVCGSDLASYRGSSAYVSYPRTLGHEFAAEVVEVAANDRGIVAGMAVTASPYFNCGACLACRRGFSNACVDNQTMGVQREGAFSDLFTMPIERVIDGTDIDPRALALIEPFSISYHGVARSDVSDDDRVLVIGAGAIGILAAVSARSLGARAYITDISAAKVGSAIADFQLDGGFVSREPDDLARFVDEVTGGDGFDVVIEAAGIPQAFLAAVDAAAPRGRVVVIGVSKTGVDFNPTAVQAKELTVVGSRAATAADFVATLDLVRSKFVDLTRLITREVAADDIVEAFEHLDAHSATTTKLLIDFTI